jgi:catechol 2,3-dioxygenase-like lactoylglutathione lyase family enzyme
MITNVSLVTVWVTDQDAAKAFYIDVLGFEEATDVSMGDGYRWLTVRHPSQPELELTLMCPGPPLDDDDAEQFRRMLAKGSLGAVGLSTDDCHATYRELSERGVEFLQEPAVTPLGHDGSHDRGDDERIIGPVGAARPGRLVRAVGAVGGGGDGGVRVSHVSGASVAEVCGSCTWRTAGWWR